MGDHSDTTTWGGLAYNPFWVTLGDIVSGALIMGLGYSTASGETCAGSGKVEMPLAAD